MLSFWKTALALALVAGTVLPTIAEPQEKPRPAPEGVTIERDVAYLPADRKEKLDLYLPANRPAGTRSPGIVIIHGGGWSSGTKSAYREFNIGTTLAKAGYVCASIDYRLDEKERWPTNIQDCKNAVRFLRKNAEKYGVDTEHMGVIGGSAGGHLALMIGLTDGMKEFEPDGPNAPYPGISSKVSAVVDMYGITDIRTGVKTDEEGNPTDKHQSWNSVFGDHQPITDADMALASPVTHITKTIPPILILQGTHDTTVDRNQSIDLDKKLTEVGVPHELVMVPGIGHTFDLQGWKGKPLPMDLRPKVTEFFDRYLKTTANPAEKPAEASVAPAR
jgi:acetyl esterase/lipase